MNIDSFKYWAEVSRIAAGFAGAEESTSYGTLAFKVKKKLFTRLKEDGNTLVVYSNERDKWMRQNPAIFFITDHYADYPMMLIDLATVSDKDLKTLLMASWKIRAPEKIVQKIKK